MTAPKLCHRAAKSTSGRIFMNTSELVTKLAETHSVSKAKAKAIVDDVLRGIVDTAASGAEVSLPGFGKFKVSAT
jgi:DNA-binding protein HU-beta